MHCFTPCWARTTPLLPRLEQRRSRRPSLSLGEVCVRMCVGGGACVLGLPHADSPSTPTAQRAHPSPPLPSRW